MTGSRRLQQMGIQSWRLKYGANHSCDSLNLSAEPAIESIPSTESEPQESLESVQSTNLTSVQSAPELSNMGWQALAELIQDDRNCPSCSAQSSLLGSGSLDADWMFIADAPVDREISAQELFVGRAGQLFDAILASIGLTKGEVYCTTVFKCMVGNDLSVTPQCKQVVHRQIALLKPKVVVTLGEFAAQSIVRANEPLDELRTVQQQCYQSKVAIVPTYSLSETLNDSGLKAHVWQDLKRCLKILKR